VEKVATELAVHFERGRDYWRAGRYLEQAARKAIGRCAYHEALGHLAKGLELLETLPDSPERAQQELVLQLTLTVPLAVLQGEAAPEVEQAYLRAKDLCQQIGETPFLFWALLGLWAVPAIREELLTARELGEQLLHLAKQTQDPVFLFWAHRALGVTAFFLGELDARTHLEQGMVLHDPQRFYSLLLDPRVTSLSYMAHTLWLLGYLDQALQKSQEAFRLAQELSHPFSLACALQFMAGFHLARREGQAAQERAEALIAFAKEQGFPLFVTA
jgi:tetratricopeptide (TPR) repeat protein